MPVKVNGTTVIDDSRNFTADTSSVQAPQLTATQKFIIPSGSTVLRPGTPAVGQMYFDTDLGSIVIYNGTNWV